MLFRHSLAEAARFLKSSNQDTSKCVIVYKRLACTRVTSLSADGFGGLNGAFFSPFLSACIRMWMRRREGGGTRNESLVFVNCGNSMLLNVFFLSEAHICYFKRPSSLHRIEKCHTEKPGWATLLQLEKLALPRGSHHQAQQ